MLIPKVIGSYPPFDNAGYSQETSFIIYFNKAVNILDFTDENGFIKNIIIQSENQNLLENTNDAIPYFKNPYLENNGKNLVVPINKGNYLIHQENIVKDIQVTINLEGLSDGVEGENASFIEKDYSFTYRVNSTKDTNDPKFEKLYFATTEEDARNGTNLIDIDEFTHYAAKANYDGDSSIVAQNIENHHINKLWINFEANDEGTGVKNVVVKEKIIRDRKGHERLDEFQEKEILNTDINSKKLSGLFKYEFFNSSDGVIRIEIQINDFAGNSKTKIIDLVKDTAGKEIEVSIENYKIYSESTPNIYDITIKGKGQSGMGYYPEPYATDIDGNEYSDTYYSFDKNDYSGACQLLTFTYWSDNEEKQNIDLSNKEYTLSSNETNYGTSLGYRKIYTCPIEVDPFKDLYYTVTSCDTIGNIYEFSSKIESINKIAGFKKDTNNAWAFMLEDINRTKGTLCFIYENEDGDKTPLLTFTTNTGTFPFSIKAVSTVDTDSELWNQWWNFVTNATTAMNGRKSLEEYKTGTYYIYFFAENKYAAEPFILYKTENGFSTQFENTTMTSADVPQVDISYDSPVLNQDKINLNVKLLDNEGNNFVMNPDYRYVLSVKYEAYIREYSATDNFSIDEGEIHLSLFSAPKYDYHITVYNRMGKLKFSTTKSIEVSEDNTPPSIKKSGFNPITQSAGRFCFTVSDAGCGLKTNEDGKPLIKVLPTDVRYADSLNDIDWDSIDFVEFNGTHIDFVFNGNINKFYYIYAEDKLGNKKATDSYNVSYELYKLKIQPVITKELVESEEPEESYVLKATLESEIYIPTSLKFEYSYLENNNWKIIGTPAYVPGPKIDGKYVFSQTIPIDDSFNQYFIKLYPYYTGQSGGETYNVLSRATYYYPDYYISNLKCSTKDIVSGQNGITILTNLPCLAHTMYCSFDIGESLEDWLNYGLETGIETNTEGFTYLNSNTNAVPSNYYYTTIIHFADGTMLMTDVKQK